MKYMPKSVLIFLMTKSTDKSLKLTHGKRVFITSNGFSGGCV